MYSCSNTSYLGDSTMPNVFSPTEWLFPTSFLRILISCFLVNGFFFLKESSHVTGGATIKHSLLSSIFYASFFSNYQIFQDIKTKSIISCKSLKFSATVLNTWLGNQISCIFWLSTLQNLQNVGSLVFLPKTLVIKCKIKINWWNFSRRQLGRISISWWRDDFFFYSWMKNDRQDGVSDRIGRDFQNMFTICGLSVDKWTR